MIRLKDQRHALAFHLGVALDLADHEQFGLDLIEKVAAQVQVSHLATLESQGELHLVAFLEEVAGAVHLNLKIVIADADRVDVDLLEPACARAGAGLILFFLLLIAPFAVIHDSADGRAGLGGNFDQVESGFARHAQGLRGGYDADLFLLVVDEPNRRNADLLIVAKIGRNGLDLLGQYLGDGRPARVIHTSGRAVGLQHVTQRPLVPTTPSRWCGTTAGTLMPASHTFNYKIAAPLRLDFIQRQRKAEFHHGILPLIGLIMRRPMHFCKNQLVGIFG